MTLELLAAARGLVSATGGNVEVIVLGRDGAGHAPSMGAADRIIVVDDPQLSTYAGNVCGSPRRITRY